MYFCKKNNMDLRTYITDKLNIFFEQAYNTSFESEKFQISPTKAEFSGDFTLICFPFVGVLKKSPDAIANEIGIFLKENCDLIHDFNVIKGFLNIKFAPIVWMDFVNKNALNSKFGYSKIEKPENIVLEYSSPNTNKPLHLGHIRNNLLGYSLSRILASQGHHVVRTNLVNDRGIHICKSMLAWLRWGNNESPESSGLKGDHLIGKYYVLFDVEYKKQQKELIEKGISEEEAAKEAPLIKEAQEMLRNWEAGEPETISIWKKMNDWVYAGFDKTYQRMGIEFDEIQYESNTYKLGKEIVEKGLNDAVFFKKEDGSIWIDLSHEGLDEKLLQRADGTSVYMTQDMGTASLRADAFNPDKMIYVVGNEQNYHFDVLKLILDKKLNYDWGKTIFHLSYGMVELPSGKMKSREGTVVDADNLMDDMVEIAKNQTEELGKIDQFNTEEANALYEMIGLGALKYFILKVDPKKNMLFDPEKSIDFNGNTASFIQYTHARISSLLAKAENIKLCENEIPSELENVEIELIRNIYQFPVTTSEAAKNYSPALIANYIFDLSKKFNQFYHEMSVLKEEDEPKKCFRIKLCKLTAQCIKNGMWLMGIEVPNRM